MLDHEQAMTALADYEVDLVLVFRPPFLPNFQPLMSLEQRIVAVMSAEHPLATRLTVRLRDCANYPVALARAQSWRTAVARPGRRREAASRSSSRPSSNSFEFLRGLVTHANLISFQIGIGTLPENNKLGLVARDIDDRDVPRANLVLGQLRARNLPIPAAIFAEKLVRALEAMRAKPGASGASAAAAASGRA